MRRFTTTVVRATIVTAVLGVSLATAQAETVMQQCGQQYQAAKAANTLNGMTWNQFRTDCATKLKAQPTSATTTAAPAPIPAAPAPTPIPAAPSPVPATTSATAAPGTTAAPATGGKAAFIARERECGSEWRTNKVALKAQTPGITWPKYLSQCNTRLKAAGK